MMASVSLKRKSGDASPAIKIMAANESISPKVFKDQNGAQNQKQNIPTKRHDLAGVFAGFRDGGFTKITEKSDDKSDSCQQNAQNRRKVGGPHAGCLTEFVLLGKYDEKDAE
jgi:hypothetical protein